MSPFDWVNSINTKTEVDISAIGTYNPFIINRALSYFDDTVFLANEMNTRHSLDNDQQYAFLFTTVSKRKRFAKWAKKEEDDTASLISEVYNISIREAEGYKTLLSKEQLKELAQTLEKGGRKK